MSDSLTSLLQEQLDKHNVTLDNWRELLQRLLDYGVLCRDDSQVEAELYDRFVRIDELVNEYLALIGLRFQHDPNFRFVRVLPPGARIAGMDDESDDPMNAGLRNRLNQHEVALILVLRAEYDKALREGSIDEQGCTTLSLEAIALAMKSLLRRSLPENMGERRQAFKRLRQLRLIQFYSEADIESSESWIKIRPLIINLASNEWLKQIRTHLADSMLLLDEENAGTEESQEAGPKPRKKNTKASPHVTRSLFAGND